MRCDTTASPTPERDAASSRSDSLVDSQGYEASADGCSICWSVTSSIDGNSRPDPCIQRPKASATRQLTLTQAPRIHKNLGNYFPPSPEATFTGQTARRKSEIPVFRHVRPLPARSLGSVPKNLARYARHKVKLLVAIPALNEEASIEAIIERTLAARAEIIASTCVDAVEVTVVSDGSTDRTIPLAQAYADDARIKLIVFESNRGYGAAIKEAWRQSDADLLGFIDADGTCDPLQFGPLCQALERSGSDIALGARLNTMSEMPRLRRLGNRLFAVMLSALSAQMVTDTASGMRVVRRSCLSRLMPLPDGLHFTPAMSARCLLGADITVIEIPMPYRERAGRSKLSIGKDGVRFLRVITATAVLYRPSRLLIPFAVLAAAVASALMINPTLRYLEQGTLAEWMIYRFVVSGLLGVTAALLASVAYVTRKLVDIALFDRPVDEHSGGLLGWFFEHRWFYAAPTALVIIGVLLVQHAFIQLVSTGHTNVHWSRFVVMSFVVSVALVFVATRFVAHFLGLLGERLSYLRTADREVLPFTKASA
jgi:glycosyltransferase involved in cell wall biosynthesis